MRTAPHGRLLEAFYLPNRCRAKLFAFGAFGAKAAGPRSARPSPRFAKAEGTIGGIATAGLSSKRMAATKVPGLCATGEAIDVTGWLIGYNLQWAWTSGAAAGEAV